MADLINMVQLADLHDSIVKIQENLDETVVAALMLLSKEAGEDPLVSLLHLLEAFAKTHAGCLKPGLSDYDLDQANRMLKNAFDGAIENVLTEYKKGRK